MKKILVPCDFSEAAIQAYYFAMNVAIEADAEVFALKVIDLPFMYETTFAATPYTFDPGIYKELEDEALKDFEKMKNKHPRQDKVKFTTANGSVTHTIRQFITTNQIDLVVMGTQGAVNSIK